MQNSESQYQSSLLNQNKYPQSSLNTNAPSGIHEFYTLNYGGSAQITVGIIKDSQKPVVVKKFANKKNALKEIMNMHHLENTQNKYKDQEFSNQLSIPQPIIKSLAGQTMKEFVNNFGTDLVKVLDFTPIKDIDQKNKIPYIVTPLIGSSLSTFQHMKKSQKLEISQVCNIGIAMIQKIREVHNRGLVHADIKPENVLIGRESTFLPGIKNEILLNFSIQTNHLNQEKPLCQHQQLDSFHQRRIPRHLTGGLTTLGSFGSRCQTVDTQNQMPIQTLEVIDFGSSRPYLTELPNFTNPVCAKPDNFTQYAPLNHTPLASLHIPRYEKKKIICTALFASRSQMMGFSLCRKDDMESIFYTLISLLGVQIEDISNYQRSRPILDRQDSFDNILCLKEFVSTQKILNILGIELKKFWEHVNSLKFVESPDYDYLIELLNQYKKQDSQKSDGLFIDNELLMKDPMWMKFDQCLKKYYQDQRKRIYDQCAELQDESSSEQILEFDSDEEQQNFIFDFEIDNSEIEEIETGNQLGEFPVDHKLQPYQYNKPHVSIL